eukprot:CAMPEP_0118641016 /NCGR_PEP_ID=MMETSP0785-20121206/5054_1 /TAXON_ID=91992 /ORGANISM="Bolidomonas pacifica, Strain CCMP 1866" /LENGTH=34 /DNA_ID= /DNA_START= /DNA_END= /DNA_ORIENTATION=
MRGVGSGVVGVTEIMEETGKGGIRGGHGGSVALA